ncbi:hypothetical protein KAS50_08250, partial [bacterium]|nr:hypothetical protein [bacterium]
MKKRLIVLGISLLLCFLFFHFVSNETINATDKNPYAVPTFECLGIYYKVKSDDLGECKVSFKQSGTDEWKEVISLWFDKRDLEYRGSIVGLTPDTEYDIRLRCGGKEVIFQTKTRSENIPVGKTTYLKGGVMVDMIHITESGSPDGWHLITAEPGSRTIIDCQGIIKQENMTNYNIVIDASYVIVRGLELKNARIHGIFIKEGVHDIVIEDCRITHWGRQAGSWLFGDRIGNYDSAIYSEKSTSGLIIQRNLIEDPRGASNDWDTGHPIGPQAISLFNTRGRHIIRY